MKIFRHRRGSNTRSSLYESDALPLGHCASRVAKKIFDVTKSMENANVSIKYCILTFLSLYNVIDKFEGFLYGAVAKW